MSFDFPFVRLLGVRQFCYYPDFKFKYLASNYTQHSEATMSYANKQPYTYHKDTDYK
jgi:hypothetical protein